MKYEQHMKVKGRSNLEDISQNNGTNNHFYSRNESD